MTALTQEREARRWAGLPGVLVPCAAAASQTIYAGALVALNAAGHAVPAAAAVGLRIAGVAVETVKSGPGAGTDKVIVRRGAVHLFANAAGANRLTQADVGAVCYVADDQTVQDDGGTNDVRVGVMLQLDDDGVWVHVGVGAP